MLKIAVIVENSSWYGRRILDGVAAYARREQQWSLVWCNPRDQSFERIIGGCQGVIARIISEELAGKLRQTDLPTVDVFCAHDHDDRFYGVDSDHNMIGRTAAEYFMSKRYSTMAFAGFKGVPFSEMRLRKFGDGPRERSILQGSGGDCPRRFHKSGRDARSPKSFARSPRCRAVHRICQSRSV